MPSKIVNSYWFTLPFLSSLIISEDVNDTVLFILNIVIQELLRGKHWLYAISGYSEFIPIPENIEEKKQRSVYSV